MSPDALDRLERLFRAARLHPPDERTAFLDAACGDDDVLRRELASLLEADAVEEGDALLDVPAAEAVARHLASFDDDEMTGQAIGPYHVLRRIGTGGMGDVYLALRKEPYRRYVALKVIRRGMDSEEARRRFEMERQILASLSHPNIAPLLDGGLTADGRPYVALEYVDGRTLTAYADERRLDVSDRIRLFQTVCRAVHYAHQNLIIHRDLKPSNILVTEDGVVKLLDFGIAKLLNPGLSPVPVPVTRETIRRMTPEYASPEQVRGRTLTTASDVYALGVLLYELLTGHRPYRLTQYSTEEIVRVVCDLDPERPSTRIAQPETMTRPDGSLEQITPDAVSAARSVSVERLQRRLRGDLDNIILKALRKEPAHRYASAEQFSEDLERYLAGQPVVARRSTRRYRTAKFIRRHRVETIAAVLVLLSLLSVLGTALWHVKRVARERDRTALALDRSEAVTEFLIDLYQANDPSEARGDTITARELLERGVERADELASQPVMQAQLLDAAGRVYDNLGRYDRAGRLLKRALHLQRTHLGDDHPLVAETMTHLGEVRTKQGAYDEAEDLLRDALAILRHQPGDETEDVIATLMGLGHLLPYQGKMAEAEAVYRDVLSLRRTLLGPEHPLVANSLSNLAQLLRRQGRYDEAEPLFREALTLQERHLEPGHPFVTDARFQLAILLRLEGAYDEAESLLRQALDGMRATGDRPPPDASSYMMELSSVLQHQGRTDEAEALLRDALALRRRVMGTHLSTAEALVVLGTFYREEGYPAQADTLFLEALTMGRSLLGPQHQFVAGLLRNRGLVAMDRGRYALADSLLHEALGMFRAVNGPEHAHVGETLADLGLLAFREGRLEVAAARYRDALALLLTHYREEHVAVRQRYRELADLYEARGLPDSAALTRARLSP